MSTYQLCENQARLIGQTFHDLLKEKGTSQQKFFLEYPDVKALNIHLPILILGLNPAGEDELERNHPNIFSYIPEYPISTQSFTGTEFEELSKFSYKRYFKTFVQEFSKISPAYHPLWYNKEILERILEENKSKFSKKSIDYVKRYCELDTGNYLLFTDLIQYSKTNWTFRTA
jgi:hypothetical protein